MAHGLESTYSRSRQIYPNKSTYIRLSRHALFRYRIYRLNMATRPIYLVGTYVVFGHMAIPGPYRALTLTVGAAAALMRYRVLRSGIFLQAWSQVQHYLIRIVYVW